MAPSTKKDETPLSLSKLSLEPTQKSVASTKPKPEADVAESWEDEDVSDGGADIQDEIPSVLSTPPKTPLPSAPPPTPASPAYPADTAWSPTPDSKPASPRTADGSRRPEKTDAVARRMIAAGLGLKAPKMTEEQRAYQRSVREQEKKKKEDQKLEEQKQREAAERAKAAVWDD